MNIEKELRKLNKRTSDNIWWHTRVFSRPFTVNEMVEVRISKILALRPLELPVEKALPTAKELKRSNLPVMARQLVLRNAGDESKHSLVLNNIHAFYKSETKNDVKEGARQIIDRWNEEFEIQNPYLASYNLEAGVLLPILNFMRPHLPFYAQIQPIIRDEEAHVKTNAIVSFGIYKEKNKARLRNLARETTDWVFN